MTSPPATHSDEPRFLLCETCDGYGWNVAFPFVGTDKELTAQRFTCAPCAGEGYVFNGASLPPIHGVHQPGLRKYTGGRSRRKRELSARLSAGEHGGGHRDAPVAGGQDANREAPVGPEHGAVEGS